jgi:DNA repair protein RadC
MYSLRKAEIKILHTPYRPIRFVLSAKKAVGLIRKATTEFKNNRYYAILLDENLRFIAWVNLYDRSKGATSFNLNSLPFLCENIEFYLHTREVKSLICFETSRKVKATKKTNANFERVREFAKERKFNLIDYIILGESSFFSYNERV